MTDETLKTYEVIIPIAGHAFIVVEAESEEDAIEKGMESITRDNIEEWEPLEQFNQGNACYGMNHIKFDAETAKKAFDIYCETKGNYGLGPRELGDDWQAVAAVFADAANSQLADPAPVFEVGKSYRMRSGKTTGILTVPPKAYSREWALFCSAEDFAFREDGTYSLRLNHAHENDLMPGAIEDGKPAFEPGKTYRCEYGGVFDVLKIEGSTATGYLNKSSCRSLFPLYRLIPGAIEDGKPAPSTTAKVIQLIVKGDQLIGLLDDGSVQEIGWNS